MHVYCIAVAEQRTTGDKLRPYTTSFPTSTFASSPPRSGGRLGAETRAGERQ